MGWNRWDCYAAKHEIEMIRRVMDKCDRPMVLSISPGPGGDSRSVAL